MEESETRCSDGGNEGTNMVYAVHFNEERSKQHETGQFILNSQIFACVADALDLLYIASAN